MSAPARVGRAWRRLEADQRLAALAAVLLLGSMLLPWYQETGFANVDRNLAQLSDSRNAFQVYSFVEASIFLVALAVLALLFARGERKAFHLPGGDGTVILAAGLWVMFLIFYRQLDKPGGRHEGSVQTSVGVQWGIFVAFLLGALLAYAGFRIRTAHIAEPPADDIPPMPSRAPNPPPSPASRDERPAERPAGRSRRAGRIDVAATDQLSFDDTGAPPPPPPPTPRADDDPATAVAWEEPRARRGHEPDEVFEPPADPDEPTEFRPGRRRP